MARRPRTTAREYLRVSQDASGRARSIDEQHAENLDAAATLGIDRFGDPYTEPPGSASRFARKRREVFGTLLDDLASGRFDADVLVLWESSRGSRKVGEWAGLIDACESAGVRIAVTSHGRMYDASNARDRRSLHEDAVDGEYESAKTSGRVKRSLVANAGAGLPHGRVAYGFRRTYDVKPNGDRVLTGQEPEHGTKATRDTPGTPDEAKIVKEMYKRIAAGHSLTSIADDFTARGITSRGSAKVPAVPFTGGSLRTMALAPAYRGVRVFHGKETDGAWEALVDDDTWYAVQARLRDPVRTTRRAGGTRHLFSRIAQCDKCGGPMTSTDRFPGARRYQCQATGCTVIDADKLDAWAEDQVLGLLTRPDVVRRLMPKAADPKALRVARDEAARVKAEHDDLVRRVAAGNLSPRMAAGAEPGILARLDAAAQHVRELATPAGLRDLIRPGPKVRAQWKGAPIEVRREVARLLFAPGVLGALSVAGVNGGPNTIGARVRLDGKRVRG